MLLSYEKQEEKQQFIDADVKVSDQMRCSPLVDLLANPAFLSFFSLFHFLLIFFSQMK